MTGRDTAAGKWSTEKLQRTEKWEKAILIFLH